MAKITEEQLVARIQSEITDSLGYGDTISQQREKAMEYYYGQPFGNEVEGRSKDQGKDHEYRKVFRE